jgi:hypothetical protein
MFYLLGSVVEGFLGYVSCELNEDACEQAFGDEL